MQNIEKRKIVLCDCDLQFNLLILLFIYSIRYIAFILNMKVDRDNN